MHAFLALIAVKRETAGSMHGAPPAFQQRIAEFLAGRAEGNGVDETTVAALQAHTDMILPDRICIDDGMVGKGHDRLRIARPEGSGARDHRHGFRAGG